MNQHGFLRLSTVSTKTAIANPRANMAEIVRVLGEVEDSDMVLFPECSITGYTCGDLFANEELLDSAVEATLAVVGATQGCQRLVVVGVPLRLGNSLFNTAVVIHDGHILGVVPKQFIPNYKEFYEGRWFRSATGDEPKEIELAARRVPFGIDLLFSCGNVVMGVEICEDLWMPIPPSSFQAVAGANVLLNLSASNAVIGKAAYRRDLVVGQSGRCIAAYAYASAGPTESTTDVVYSGHCLVAENGRLLAESDRVGTSHSLLRESTWNTVDVDIDRLRNERRTVTSFDDCSRHVPRVYRRIEFSLRESMSGLRRTVSGRPFVPVREHERHARCGEIFGIQCAALAKRVEQLPNDATLHIGISGGLDSTLALLVATKMCDRLEFSRRRIHGLTMPGFGTTNGTRTNATHLMEHLQITAESVNIRELCLQAFRDLSHRPFGIDCSKMSVAAFQEALHNVPDDQRSDLVFENVQARIRTFLLMNRGFVIGTGDMSEAALGWSTYNGDHMSMYNPNCSIPKTLVRFLVRYAAEHEFEGHARETLLAIAETTISPELLPPSRQGEILQSTEQTLGPYELHDFFLFHFVRNGFSRKKILFLSQHADFSEAYDATLIEKTLDTFCRRFFANQFKRSCVPDGPKVGTVSLSPRGDWRMPSDADPGMWTEG